MLKALLILAAIALLGFAASCKAHPSPEELRRAVVTLSAASGGPSSPPICTGVALGPHVVYTAKHCVYEEILPGMEILSMPKFNGWGCPTDRVIADDGTDNVLIRTCVEFKYWSKLSLKAPEIGSPVQLWGHVLALPLQYRRGYLASKFIQPDNLMYPGAMAYVWDMQAAGGDSGGPFFNDKGEVMCVTSHGILRRNWPHFALVACFPPKFTTKELRMIK